MTVWSERAILVNIEIMRAFVQIQVMASSYKNLARKLDTLERKSNAQFKKCWTPSANS